MRYASLLALLIVPVLGLIFVNEIDTLISSINGIPDSLDVIVSFVPFSLILICVTGLTALISATVWVFLK